MRITKPIAEPREMTPAELIRDDAIEALEDIVHELRKQKNEAEDSAQIMRILRVATSELERISKRCPWCGENGMRELVESQLLGSGYAEVLVGYQCENCGWGERF